MGDVIVGDKYHEQLKRPYDVNDIKSTVLSIKEPYNKIYIIGKCYFDDVEFDVSKFGGKIEEWAAWEAPGFAQFELASLRANLFFQSAVVVLQRCHSLCLRTSVM